MPGKKAAEFTWIEAKGLYRKRIKNPYTGKWHDIYGGTKDETRAKIKRTLEEWAEVASASADPKVYEYCKTWFELNTLSVGEKRRGDYSNAINNHICPIIGNKSLSSVTHDDILAVLLACSKLSKSSQQKIVTTLKRVFAAAELNGYISRSPCGDIKAGGAAAEEKIALTSVQTETLLLAVAGTRAELFVRLGLYTGMRREEVLGLKWDCVHLDAAPPYVEVKRALKWGNGNSPVITEKLKSKAAYRNIPIPPQIEQSLAAAKNTAKGDFVICDTKGGAMSAQSYRKLWDVIVTRSTRTVTRLVNGQEVVQELKLGDKVRNHNIYITIDFKVTSHILRHTYITNMIMACGMKYLKTVQYLAGHSSIKMTLDIYTHLIENQPCDTVHAVLSTFAPESKSMGVNQGVQGNTESHNSIENTVYTAS